MIEKSNNSNNDSTIENKIVEDNTKNPIIEQGYMPKVKRTLAYIFAFPIGLIVAIVISGTLSVLQNFFNIVCCNLVILPKWFLSNYTACNGNYSSRTFLADLVFFIALIDVTERIVPNHKKLIKFIVTVFASILSGILVFLSVLSKTIFSDAGTGILYIFIGLTIWAVVQFKSIKK